ncbi:MAG: hypothetical protein KA184_05985 [Candidatus Hydrogenedentes bacterium]|nr:hypothetical protein [Candidatus Hydrogenedentota bacterium]
MQVIVRQAKRVEVIRRAHDAFLERYTSDFGVLDVAHVSGTPEDMGAQYGALVGDRAKAIAGLLAGLFSQAGLPEALVHVLLDACWERLAPHVPERYLAEMRAIEAGAKSSGADLSFDDVKRILTMTNLDLYKREERLPEILGIPPEELAAAMNQAHLACTMFAVWGSRTADGKMFSLRNLDWVSQTGMHEYRLITVYQPQDRHAFVSMGYAGVIGCLAGMNDQGITLSEVGAFSVREELDGMPWALMGRRVLEESGALEDAQAIIERSAHTIGYNYLIADGEPDAYGTPAFRPRAAAFETNSACCETFFEDDPKEHAATWTDAQGGEHYYGRPLREAVLRADTAFGKQARALQAADDGPGDPANTGNPHGRDFSGSTYTTCHLPMHDMIRAYETGSEYVFPVRGTKPIEAGPPCKIGPEEALTIAATVAHNTEMLPENDWNVMSIVYAPTDLEFWAAYETRHEDARWTNAPDSGYWRFSLRKLLEQDAQ